MLFVMPFAAQSDYYKQLSLQSKFGFSTFNSYLFSEGKTVLKGV